MKERKLCYECGGFTVHVGLSKADYCVVCDAKSKKDWNDRINPDLFVFDRLFKQSLVEHQRKQ
jgi:hypothetical protein